jgi:membrane protein DedA with SNARE-associated domain
MFPLDIEAFISGGSYLAIFVLMTGNGLLSFPSSQVLYIVVGFFIWNGTLELLPAALAGALGNTLGCVLLYEGVRKWGIAFVRRFAVFKDIDLGRLEASFRNRGAWFIFVGKLLPAIKVFVPIPAGLGKMDRPLFAVLMFVASLIWAFAFIAIGFAFGKSASLWKSYSIILFVIAIAVVFLFGRYIERSARPPVREDADDAQR